MPIYQTYNKRIKAWVKYHWTKQGWKVKDIKQREPMKKFKGVPVKCQKK